MKLYAITILLLGHMFVAQTSLAKSWLQEDKKIIYILNKPAIKVVLNKIAADDEYYGQLSITSSFDNEEIKKETHELAQLYPSYTIRYAAIRALSEYKMIINSSKKEFRIKAYNTPEGASLSKIIYLNKREYVRLRKTIRMGEDAFSFHLEAKTLAPVLKTLEYKSLGRKVCYELFKDGASTYSVMTNLRVINDRIESMGIKYESTRSQLVEKVKSSCIELDEAMTISSFDELLNTQLQKKPNSEEITASTKRKVLDNVNLELNRFNTTQELEE